MSQYKSQEPILSEVEFTFLWVYEQRFLQESLKHQLHLLNMFVLGSGVTEYVIYWGLKNRWGNCKAKAYDDTRSSQGFRQRIT